MVIHDMDDDQLQVVDINFICDLIKCNLTLSNKIQIAISFVRFAFAASSCRLALYPAVKAVDQIRLGPGVQPV